MATGKDMVVKSYDMFRRKNAGKLWEVNRWKDDEAGDFLKAPDGADAQRRRTLRKHGGRKFR